MDYTSDLKRGERGAWLSIFAYIFLSILKLTVGIIGGSEALRADGLNNSTDVIASVAVLIGLKIARKPPDEDHHYGHTRAETIASLAAAFIMVTVGLQVLVDAGQSLYLNNNETPEILTAWVALFSSAVMFGVYRYNSLLAAKVNSNAIKAAAADNKSDALVSIGAFVGIIGARLGIGWLDSVTAFLVGIIIIKTAWDIFRESTHALTDGFEEAMLKKIEDTIRTTKGVTSVRLIKGRMHGSKPLVDATVCVDPQITVYDGHKITEDIERRMKQEHNITYVHIHIEPESKDNK
ncbi:cation transporter [Bacillus sp. HMF5848]|uniref:cation diffusion facilitator family transporter n=1 Tax=Bacillus sp. HMF5848 TaxID=2495421 RepID=UPI000F790D72|nr:cation diffusion facilitator family transporter [Bacillus sp. HMF5848]RSK26136.1 cation transporter [Bacillus sp. HMF5848]